MLGKLMKYEFRATAIYFLPIYAMLILVSGLRYAVSLITEKFSGSYPVFSTFGLSAAYFLLAFGLAVTTFVVIIIRFYKNLLGAEGYLMFTLPVSISQNILAKLIPAVVWFFGSLTLGMLTIAPAMGMRFRDNPLVLMFTGVHLSDLPEIILGLLFVIGSIAMVFLFYYLCMCIGQLFNSHRFLASVGVYIGLQMLLQTMSIVFMWIFTKAVADNMSSTIWIENFLLHLDEFPTDAIVYGFLITINVVVYGLSAALFFINNAILKKRLNLI